MQEFGTVPMSWFNVKSLSLYNQYPFFVEYFEVYDLTDRFRIRFKPPINSWVSN